LHDLLGAHRTLNGIVLELTQNKLEIFFQSSGSIFLLRLHVTNCLKKGTYGIDFFFKGYSKNIENSTVGNLFGVVFFCFKEVKI
jgi:hypothetical protein